MEYLSIIRNLNETKDSAIRAKSNLLRSICDSNVLGGDFISSIINKVSELGIKINCISRNIERLKVENNVRLIIDIGSGNFLERVRRFINSFEFDTHNRSFFNGEYEYSVFKYKHISFSVKFSYKENLMRATVWNTKDQFVFALVEFHNKPLRELIMANGGFSCGNENQKPTIDLMCEFIVKTIRYNSSIIEDKYILECIKNI